SSGLRERYSFCAYFGVGRLLRSDLGSATCASVFFSEASCSGVRCRIQTGLPRHSTTVFSPGFKPPMSASTGAPAAFARSDGVKLATNGTAVATPPTAPTPQVIMTQLRRAGSAKGSDMEFLAVAGAQSRPGNRSFYRSSQEGL